MQSRKESIHAAAASLFRKRGYRATSMRDIAQVVGIKAASIYNHIHSKQQLLAEMLLTVARQFSQEMNTIRDSSLTSVEKLERLVALHVRLTAEYTDTVALIAGEWVHLEEPARGQYIELRNRYELDFKAILEAGKDSGQLRPIDTEVMLFSILSTLRWLYSWYSRNRDYNLVELERQMVACLLDGIKKS